IIWSIPTPIEYDPVMRRLPLLASLLFPMFSHAAQPVSAEHGMVATTHVRAAQIGVEILKRGGNAIDAAIATNAAMGVVEPMSCGIGGDLYALVWDAKSQKLFALNASG